MTNYLPYVVAFVWGIVFIYNRITIVSLRQLVKTQREVIKNYPETMDAARRLYNNMRERAEAAEIGLHLAQRELLRHGVEMKMERVDRPQKEKEN